MLRTAVEHPGPIAIRYPRGYGLGVHLDEETRPLPIGKGEILASGKDIAILAVGATVSQAVEAAKQLKSENISATVVNSRFVKPLDTDLVTRLAKEIAYILTVEENVLEGGFGSAVLECIAEAGVTSCRIKRLGIPDTFVEHGSQKILRANYSVDAAAIVKAVKDMIDSSSE
jgi:1-deoxy-D-xylulose-5-phosphate synthase